MDQSKAENIVSSYVESQWPGMAVMKELTKENENCYSVYIQSKDYIKSRDLGDMAIGHGVMIVSKTNGELFPTGSGLDPKEAAKRFDIYGDPYVAPGSSKKFISNPNSETPLESTQVLALFKRFTGFGLSRCKEIVKDIDSGIPFESEFHIDEEDLNQLASVGFKLTSAYKRNANTL